MTNGGNLGICESVFGDDWLVSVSSDEKLLIARYYRPSRPTVKTDGFAKRKDSGVRVNSVLDEYQILLPEIDREFRVDTAEDVRDVLSDTIDAVAQQCEERFLIGLLTDIDGLGKSRAEDVFDEFGSIDAVLEASNEEILSETDVASTMIEDDRWPDEELVESYERDT